MQRQYLFMQYIQKRRRPALKETPEACRRRVLDPKTNSVNHIEKLPRRAIHDTGIGLSSR